MAFKAFRINLEGFRQKRLEKLSSVILKLSAKKVYQFWWKIVVKRKVAIQ